MFSVCAEMALSRAVRAGKPVLSGRLAVRCVPFFDNYIIWKGYVGGALVFFAVAKDSLGTGFRLWTEYGYELCSIGFWCFVSGGCDVSFK